MSTKDKQKIIKKVLVDENLDHPTFWDQIIENSNYKFYFTPIKPIKNYGIIDGSDQQIKEFAKNNNYDIILTQNGKHFTDCISTTLTPINLCPSIAKEKNQKKLFLITKLFQTIRLNRKKHKTKPMNVYKDNNDKLFY